MRAKELGIMFFCGYFFLLFFKSIKGASIKSHFLYWSCRLPSFCLSVICVLCIALPGTNVHASPGGGVVGAAFELIGNGVKDAATGCGNATLPSNLGTLIIPKEDLSQVLGLNLCPEAILPTVPNLINTALLALSVKELVEFYIIMRIAYERMSPEQKASKLHVVGLWAAGIGSFLGAGAIVGGVFYSLTSGLISVPEGQAKTVTRMVEAITYALGVNMCLKVTKQWREARATFLESGGLESGGELTTVQVPTIQEESFISILGDIAINCGREGGELGVLAGAQLSSLATPGFQFAGELVNGVLASVFTGIGAATMVPAIIYGTDKLVNKCGNAKAKRYWNKIKYTFKKWQVGVIGVTFLMYALTFNMSHEVGELFGVEDYVARLNVVADYLGAIWPIRSNLTFWDAVVAPLINIVLIVKLFLTLKESWAEGEKYDETMQAYEAANIIIGGVQVQNAGSSSNKIAPQIFSNNTFENNGEAP